MKNMPIASFPALLAKFLGLQLVLTGLAAPLSSRRAGGRNPAFWASVSQPLAQFLAHSGPCICILKNKPLQYFLFNPPASLGREKPEQQRQRVMGIHVETKNWKQVLGEGATGRRGAESRREGDSEDPVTVSCHLSLPRVTLRSTLNPLATVAAVRTSTASPPSPQHHPRSTTSEQVTSQAGPPAPPNSLHSLIDCLGFTELSLEKQGSRASRSCAGINEAIQGSGQSPFVQPGPDAPCTQWSSRSPLQAHPTPPSHQLSQRRQVT